MGNTTESQQKIPKPNRWDQWDEQRVPMDGTSVKRLLKSELFGGTSGSAALGRSQAKRRGYPSV
jgi:hypothetical protein